MSNFKNTDSAKVLALLARDVASLQLLESLKYRINTAIRSIDDIRYSLSEIMDELTEVSELADELKDIIDAEDE